MPSHIADQVVIACDTFLFLKVFIYADMHRYIYAHTHMKIIFSNHKYVLGIGKMEMCHQKGNALCPEVGSSKSSLGRAGPRGVLTLLWSKVSNLTSLLSYLTCKTGNSLFQGCCRTDNSIYKVCLEQE